MITLEYLIGQLAGGVYDASCLGQIPIFNVLAQDQAIEFGKKLVRNFHDSNHYIEKKAQEIMSRESKESRDFVVCAAKECFGMIDTENILEEKHYNSWVLSSEKADVYLNAQVHLNDKEEQLLKTYLTPLVESAVSQLHQHLIEDPEFLNQAIETHHEKIAELDDRIQEVETRSAVPNISDSIVADISEELKNLWNDYPFLDWGRANPRKLREFYKLPFGKFRENGKPDADIHEFLQEITDSGNDRHKRMLVLMGVPGSGKTTVITYLLNNLKIDRPVRVYPLSGFVNMNPSNWPGDLLSRAGLVQEDLSNSILVLDGLDELDLHGQYDPFVEKLRIAWANNDKITNFTLILTCRTNRLNPDTLRCSHITLAPLSKKQISEFATDYLGECPPNLQDCLEEKEDLCDVLGIPILLYMVLGLGLTVDSDISIADLYDEIFSLNGDNSIYRRCYNQQKHPLTAALAEKIHLFSQDVAVEMFARDEVQEELEKVSYTPLAEKAIGDHAPYTPEDLLIGQYFLLGHKEGKIYFVHRSIFEYFVALAIFNTLVKLAKIGKIPEQLYGEMEPGKSCDLTPLATLLSLHHLSDFPEIKDFLHHLIRVHSDALSGFSDWAKLMKLFFEYSLIDAVPDRAHGGEQGFREEAYRFLNLLDICRCILLQTQSSPIDLLPQSHHKGRMSPYWSLLYQNQEANLRKLDFSGANFSGANLSMANLSRADLSRADLSGTNLSGANLFWSDLTGAHLSGAILSEANLGGADLSGVDLSEANLSGANLSGAHLSGADLSMTTLPDKRKYEDALAEDGEDVILQFIHPWRWNELHPDKAINPNRFRLKWKYRKNKL